MTKIERINNDYVVTVSVRMKFGNVIRAKAVYTPDGTRSEIDEYMNAMDIAKELSEILTQKI